MEPDEYVPQTISVGASKPWMERPIELAVTDHPNGRHGNTVRVFLDRDTARAVVDGLIDMLTKEEN